jgi:hypothetical protein
MPGMGESDRSLTRREGGVEIEGGDINELQDLLARQQ